MNTSDIRRAVGLLATPALALATVAALPSARSHAAEPDPAPLHQGATWLAGELDGGLLPSPYGGPDQGLSIDAALSLQQAGAPVSTLTSIRDAVEAVLASYAGHYTWYERESDPDGAIIATYAGDSSNATAKAAVLAQTTGGDAKNFGDRNLITDLGGMLGMAGPTLGRLTDSPTKDGQPYPAGDYANTLGQSFAARALDAAGSDSADEATNFLLAQQCDAGYFRFGFSAADAGDQTCDDATSEPDTDATALALLNLVSQADDPDVRDDIDQGLEWLRQAQRADGSFGGAGVTSAPNGNSTGLAGWALGTYDADSAAAARAATWLRSVQAADPAPCTTGLTAVAGAIGYDPAGHAAGRATGVTDTADQWRRTTAQALPALRFAPATGTGAALPVVVGSGYRAAGSNVQVWAAGLAPGDTVCVSRDGKRAALLTVGSNGQAVGSVTLPAGTATRTFALRTTEAAVGSFSFKVLGAKRVPFTLKKTVRKGAKQAVRVAGLASGETVRVFLRGKRVAAGRANRAGVFVKSFRVGTEVGRARVKVVGQFADRTATKTFRVVR
jgi:hypothetical protein